MAVYNLSSCRPLFIENNKTIKTKFCDFNILGNKKKLIIIKTNNNIYDIKLTDNETIIKINIINLIKPIAIHDENRNKSFYVFNVTNQGIDFLPDHIDEDGNPIQLVIENTNYVYNKNNNMSDNNTISFCISEINLNNDDSCVTDSLVRKTVEKSINIYKKTDKKKIYRDTTEKIILNFVF